MGLQGARRHDALPGSGAGNRGLSSRSCLAALPDRGQQDKDTNHHFTGAGNDAAGTGWPNMRVPSSGGNRRGLPASGQTVTLRSLDFWRIEGRLIRENWGLVDVLDENRQVGTDPLDRMRQMNLARDRFDRCTGEALP